MKNNLLDNTFHLTLLAKGLNGLLETIGGFLLLITSSNSIHAFVNFITIEELSEDPTDIVANAISSLTTHINNGKLFGAIYLLTHGIVKLIIVGLFASNNTDKYPWAISALLIFTIYQAYLTVHHSSLGFALLTILDAIIVILAWLEYKRLLKTKKSETYN